MRTVKLLIGGSPCTHWSIAKNSRREAVPSGTGWELFKNFLTAREKFKPDYFLYENVASMSDEIRSEIEWCLEEPAVVIDSADFSAQTRKRMYVTDIPLKQYEKYKNICVVNDILQDEWDAAFMKTYMLKNMAKRKSDKQVVFIGNIGTRSAGHCVFSQYGKSVTLMANGGGCGAKTGLYMIKTECTNDELINVVSDGKIIIDNVCHDICLPDGNYVIRKLTPVECERLQTLPDNYTDGVSDTQRYKCLGNGWTAEVIIHILSGMELTPEVHLEVLSMYDGIATGLYCLKKMGYHDIIYNAYEIDKYAIKIAVKNHPEIIQRGDAFNIRDEKWEYKIS